MAKKILILFFTLIFLVGFDIMLTFIGLSLGATEISPITLVMMDWFGLYGAAMLKLALIAFLGFMSTLTVWYAEHHEKRSIPIVKGVFYGTYLFTIGLHACVVISNLLVLNLVL